MPTSSITAYRTAVKMGNTLASANIASRFLDAGFKDEAIALLADAARVPQHHQNVDTQFARAKEIDAEEEKKKIEIEERAAVESTFYRAFGRRLIALSRPDFRGQWIGPRCTLNVTQEGETLTARGTYEIKPNALASAIGGIPGKPIVRFVEYKGTMRGLTVSGIVETGEEGKSKPMTSLLGGDDVPRFIAWLSDDDLTLHVQERTGNSSSPKHYQLTRSSSAN